MKTEVKAQFTVKMRRSARILFLKQHALDAVSTEKLSGDLKLMLSTLTKLQKVFKVAKADQLDT